MIFFRAVRAQTDPEENPVSTEAVVDSIVASRLRREAWRMIKPVDPTGTWYRPVMQCAIQLFDAAHDLDGQRGEDEPTQASVDDALSEKRGLRADRAAEKQR